jgi:uncharacterized protein involved in high-affinity Fe2+ transport
MIRAIPALAAASLLASLHPAAAKEYFVGGPVHQQGMEIVADYLLGVTLAPMPKDMPTGADVIHLETDVHALADNPYGFKEGDWIGYLTIRYTLSKTGTDWHTQGTLRPMQANDGPLYASNVRMDGPGQYKLTLRFTPPDAAGLVRHTDKETGVPAWWVPFSQDFSFAYPQP